MQSCGAATERRQRGARSHAFTQAPCIYRLYPQDPKQCGPNAAPPSRPRPVGCRASPSWGNRSPIAWFYPAVGFGCVQKRTGCTEDGLAACQCQPARRGEERRGEAAPRPRTFSKHAGVCARRSGAAERVCTRVSPAGRGAVHPASPARNSSCSRPVCTQGLRFRALSVCSHGQPLAGDLVGLCQISQRWSAGTLART